jgi:protein-tyrosine kinase
VIGRRDRGEPDSRARVVMLQDPDGAAANAFRLALSNVLPRDRDGQTARRTLVVAVDSRADGPIATANLAVAAAGAGIRTILIDGNVRHPRLHALLGVANDRGLSTIGGADAATTGVVPTDVAGLALIPAGPPSSGGVDLLARPAVGDAVAAATAAADLVLVSCVAFLDGPDAILISRWVDSAILVVGARGTRRTDGTRAKEQLERAGVIILGALFYGESRGVR